MTQKFSSHIEAQDNECINNNKKDIHRNLCARLFIVQNRKESKCLLTGKEINNCNIQPFHMKHYLATKTCELLLCNDMDKALKKNSGQKKPDTKVYILCGSVYIKF